MKKNVLIFGLVVFSLLTFSCSSDEAKEVKEVKNEKNVTETSRIGQTYSIESGNVSYKFSEESNISLYENDTLSYEFNYSNFSDIDIVDEYDDVIIKNPITNEFFRLYNIESHEGYEKFDLETSSGKKLYNIKFYNDEKILTEGKYCWQCVYIVVTTVAGVLVDMTSDSYDSNCNKAISACGSGGVKSITIIDNGWFQAASCTVICK
ncbi:hypothetical protein FLJC2902T_12200 [Flavobacterium limnosediminis JC2902]|uniref:Lipoprotein n=1 Tax=Flavobacterium limnosediminis JC2902 TaxID=1341181 RepID=V6SR60_9FLAO|nr:hypothetical protein [Flavobacterium limnosediminis]ESU29178.1 hypothetical protein FLJC2902T_12200 [Flavobacterium limnosediminis JC2902]